MFRVTSCLACLAKFSTHTVRVIFAVVLLFALPGLVSMLPASLSKNAFIEALSLQKATAADISGICKIEDKVSNCGDGRTIKVAVNNTLQAQDTTTSSGTWTITGVTIASGDIVTVFINTVTNLDEAVAVTKYDGVGNITGVDLFEQHLTIGSDDLQTISNADLSQFDNSVSGDEDVFHEVNASNNLTVDSSNLLTEEVLYIKAGNIFRPDSASSGNVATHDVEINGTFIADNNTITLNGSWLNNGVFTTGGSSTNFTVGSGTETIDSTGATTADFYNITFNDGGGTATFQLESALDVSNDLTVTDGILDTKNASNYAIAVGNDFLQPGGQVQARASTLTVTRHFTVDGTESSTGYNSATLLMNGTGTLTYSNLTSTWENGINNMTAAQSGNTTTLTNQMAVINQLTVGSGSLTGASANLYLRSLSTSNPLVVDSNSIIDIDELRFLVLNASANLPPLTNGYDSSIIIGGVGTTLSQTGSVTINAGSHLIIDGDFTTNRVDTYNTNGFDLNVGGNIQVGTGSDTGLKTLNGTNSNITVSGNIDIRSGTTAFTSTGSTVTLNGTAAQTVLSDGESFNNLIITNASVAGVSFLDALTTTNLTNNTAGSTLTFKAGAAYAVSGVLTLSGSSGNEIVLQSDTPGTQWNFNVTGSKTINYLDVTDSNASGSSAGNKPLEPTNSLDSGNNTDWFSDCTVVKTDDAGSNTLRDCITYANSNPGITIKFNIPNTDTNYQTAGGDNWWRITPITVLPGIVAANIIIDGTSQTTNQGNTNSLGPEIEINGSTVGAGGWDGFGVSSPATNITIKGLIISQWSGAGISLWTGTGTVTGNYIGTNYAGTAAAANNYGIYLNTAGNTIGGTSAATRNVIAGNSSQGIYIEGDNNTIQGNYIGVNVSGNAILANGSDGIYLTSAVAGNIIGGTVAGAGNIISGNANEGINYQSTGSNNVQGNYIGTNASSASLPNGANGIHITTGTLNLGNVAETISNVIGPNTGNGINLAGGTINLAGTINVNDDIQLSSGTFSMGSATLNVSGNWTQTAATVTPATSTVVLNGVAQTVTPGASTFNHLTLNMTGQLTMVGNLDVNGNLTITSATTIADGDILVAGNVVTTDTTVNGSGAWPVARIIFDGTGAQTLSASGGSGAVPGVNVNKASGTLLLQDTIELDFWGAAWTWTQGTVDPGTSTVIANWTGSSLTTTFGGQAFYNFIISLTAGVAFNAGGGEVLDVNGDFTMNAAHSYPNATVAGDLYINTTGMNGNAYSNRITIDGSGAQTYNGTGRIDSMTIAKPSGTLTFASNPSFYGNSFIHSSGDVAWGATTFNILRSTTINSGSMAFGNVTFNASIYSTTVTGTMIVADTLNIAAITNIDGGTIESRGNITGADATVGGTANIILTGSVDQTISAIDLPNGNFEVNKATGDALLGTALTVSGNTTITQGVLDLSGYNLTLGGTFSNTDTLRLLGSETLTSFTNDTDSGTIEYNGTTAGLSLAAGNNYFNLVFNGIGGVWTQSAAIDINGDLTITNGTLDVDNIGNYQINLAGDWSNSTTFTERNGTVVLDGTNQTINGSTAFYNLIKSVATTDTLTFQAGQTTTIASGGTATLNGASGQLLSLVSATPATRWNFTLTNSSAKSIDYVSVTDSDANGSDAAHKPINPTNSTDGGNNIAWFTSMSGTVYTDDDEATPMSGETVRLVVNGIDTGLTDTTDGSGNYAINYTPTVGQTVLVYLDSNGGNQGTTVTVSDGSSLGGLNIYQNHVVNRHDNAGALSNALLNTADHGDADIQYNVAAGNLTVTGSHELYIPAGHSFAPAGNITTPYLESLGIFNGGTGAININGALTIGGGTYTHTSGTTTLNGNLTVSGGTVDANNGSILFYSNGTNWTINGTHTLNNITFDNNSGGNRIWTITGGTEITVAGTLTFNTTGTNAVAINTGIINAQGNIIIADNNAYSGTGTIKINGAGDQTFSANATLGNGDLPNIEINKPSGTLTLSGTLRTMDNNWTYVSGALSTTGSTVVFARSGGGAATISGSHSLDNIVFSNAGSGGRTWTIASGTELTMTDALTFNNSDTGQMNIDTGVLNAQGNIVVADSYHYGGTATLKINGTGNQSFTGSATRTSGDLPNIEINKPSGTLTIAGTLRNSENTWTYISGALSTAGSTVIFGNLGNNGTIVGSHTLNNVVFDNIGGNWRTWTLGGGTTLSTAGTLTIDSTNASYGLSLNNGTLKALGNVVIGDPANSGTTVLEFSGAAMQTFDLSGDTSALNLDVLVNKSNGSVDLLSALTMDANNQDLIIQEGSFDLNGNNLTVSGTGSTFIIEDGGNFQLQGVETTTIPTLNVGSTVTYEGAGSYTGLTAGDNYHHLTFNNAAGSWTLNAPLDVSGNFTHTTGTIDVSVTNHPINVAGNWNNSGTFTQRNGTVVLDGTSQSITGSTTFYNLNKSVVSADTLTFDAAGTQSIASGGHVNFNGTAGNVLQLRSSSTPTQWGFNVDAGATTDIYYVDVQDSNASAGATVSAYFSQQPGGNNLNWSLENLQLVKQVWSSDGSPVCLASRPAKADCNSSATTTVVPVGSTIYFLIYVSNVSGASASDIRFTDLLDDTGFTYLPNTLESTATGSEPADTASSTDIFNATTTPRSDAFDGNTGIDEFTGIDTSISPDNLTAGGDGGVSSNDTINIPANKTFAIRFQAMKN